MRVMSFYLCPNERGSMPPGNFSQRSKTSMNYFERENMLRFSCARCVPFIFFLHLLLHLLFRISETHQSMSR